jgi:hypothetical protein
MHVLEKIPSLSRYVKTIYPNLDEMVKKLLAKNPEERSIDLTEVIYELTKWERQSIQVRLLQVDPGKAVASS